MDSLSGNFETPQAAGQGWLAACSVSRCQARQSSLREMAVVAILGPRRAAMAVQAGSKPGDLRACWAAWFRAQRRIGDPCLEMWPCRTLTSLPRTVGVRPAQEASL